MNHPIKLYRFRLSGHSHRVELFSLLGVPFERIEVELGKGEHKTPAFLSLNRFGQVPVIEDRGYILADSNAILVYLAIAYDPERRWYPNDSVGAASVQRWLSAAAGPLLTDRLMRASSVSSMPSTTSDAPMRSQENSSTLWKTIWRRKADILSAAITPSPTSRSTPTPRMRLRGI